MIFSCFFFLVIEVIKIWLRVERIVPPCKAWRTAVVTSCHTDTRPLPRQNMFPLPTRSSISLHRTTPTLSFSLSLYVLISAASSSYIHLWESWKRLKIPTISFQFFLNLIYFHFYHLGHSPFPLNEAFCQVGLSFRAEPIFFLLVGKKWLCFTLTPWGLDS